MSEQGLAVGRDALARAMELARKSGRAAKVAALLVPLAAIAAQHPAHAIVVPLSAYGGSKSMGFGDGTSGSVSWDVSSCGVDPCWSYSIDLSVSASGITEVDIPVNYATLDDLEVNGFGIGSGEFNVTYSDGESMFTASGYGLNPFDITFESDLAPTLVSYNVTDTNGTTISIDPPIPGAVPEPGTLALFGMALVGFGALRRRLTG